MLCHAIAIAIATAIDIATPIAICSDDDDDDDHDDDDHDDDDHDDDDDDNDDDDENIFSIFEVRFKQMCKTTQNGNKPIPEANSKSHGKYINTRTPPVQKSIRFKSAKPNVKCEP